MANSKNLKPFKKGRSGNPRGRPRGSLNVKTKLRKLVESGCAIDDLAKSHKHLTPGLVKALREKFGNIPIGEMIVYQMLYNALLSKHSERGIENIMNRLYGTPIPASAYENKTSNLIISAREFSNIPAEDAARVYQQIAQDATALTGYHDDELWS